ncbi:MAG TPA: hypothetical protein VJZ06_04940 [Mobilitalea sp.]|nr:hypothetical protein [Mobilitalea sp.]
MLIRSQNKKDLVSLDDIGIIPSRKISGTYDIEIYKHDAHCLMGRYSTEAKAIKVLDMICDAYERCERTDYQNIGYVGNGVFQMPLDEIVKGGGKDEQ